MNPTEFGLVSSIYTLGGLLGALSAGPLSTSSGRLPAMRYTTLFFVVGPLFETLAASIWMIALGRFLAGIGAGAAIVVVPIYIAEIVPEQSKGLFGALTQVLINVGILVAQVLGYFLSYGNMWRVVLVVAGGIGIIQFLGLFLVPESPQWLATKGRTGLANRILKRVRGRRKIDENVGDLGTAEEGEGRFSSFPKSTAVIVMVLIFFAFAEEAESLLDDSNGNRRSASKNAMHAPLGIFQVVVHPNHYKAIIAVSGVMVAQQLCGINSIVMYSVSILSDLLPTSAGLITVAVGVLNLIVTVACAPLADRLGRKVCLLLSIAGMATNALLLALGLLFRVKPLSAVATLLFVASFAVGLGPVPFILSSELVGPEAVGATQSWALAANWVATFLVAQFFPILDNALGGRGKVYFVFFGFGVAFFIFVAAFVPETRGKRDADEVWGRERRED